MSYSVTQFGKPLDKSLYVIDENNKIFSSEENNLVLDFMGLGGWNFKTGSRCIFETSGNCIFNTSYACTFNTSWNCTFNTGSNCTFKTDDNCIFNTEEDCAFHTLWGCTFHAGGDCTFNIVNDFKKIEIKGYSTVLIKNDFKNKSVCLNEEVEIYFDGENNEILYTKEKWTKDKYLMMKELRK